MSEPIIIRSPDEPTVWNRYTVTGALLGALPALAVVAGSAFITGGLSALATLTPYIAGLAGASILGGAVAGGLYGKNEMEKSYYQGKTVTPPHWANNDLVDGVLVGIGLTLATVAGMGLIAGAAAVTTATGLTSLAAGAIGFGIAGTLGLGYAAGRRGYDRLAKDYQNAQALHTLQHNRWQQRALDKSTGNPTINVSDIKRLNEKLKMGKRDSYVDFLEESRRTDEIDKTVGM